MKSDKGKSYTSVGIISTVFGVIHGFLFVLLGYSSLSPNYSVSVMSLGMLGLSSLLFGVMAYFCFTNHKWVRSMAYVLSSLYAFTVVENLLSGIGINYISLLLAIIYFHVGRGGGTGRVFSNKEFQKKAHVIGLY